MYAVDNLCWVVCVRCEQLNGNAKSRPAGTYLYGGLLFGQHVHDSYGSRVGGHVTHNERGVQPPGRVVQRFPVRGGYLLQHVRQRPVRQVRHPHPGDRVDVVQDLRAQETCLVTTIKDKQTFHPMLI